MANLTKLYLRNDTNTAKTLPGTASLDAAVPTVVATGGTVNRTLQAQAVTTTIQVEAGQQTASLTTLAQTAAQSGWLRRFVSDPLSAQTIGAQSISLSGAFSESAGQSDFRPSFGLYLWRPSTTSTVATLIAVGTALAPEPGTTQTLGTATATSTAGTAADGDLLVLELWRASGTQVNATSRTNSAMYDGQTEGSITDTAAFVTFATAVSIPTTFTSSQNAGTASMSGALTTSLIAAPRGLTAVFTHTE